MAYSRILVGLSGAVLAIVACSSAPAGTTAPTTKPTTAATATAGVPGGPTTAPTVGIPTPGATLPPGVGDICSQFPTFNPTSGELPSFAPDPTLEAHFPTTVDGQPVTDVSSGSFAQFLCLGGPTALQGMQAGTVPLLMGLTWGTAKATVDGNEVTITAFRSPGGDGNQIVSGFAQLAAAAGNDNNLGAITQGTAGGKNVLIAKSTDGSTTTYIYVTGDTVVFTDADITQAQADKIFSAVP